MDTAAVEKGAHEEDDHLEGAVVYGLENAVYAVLGEKTVQNVSAVGKGEIVVEAGGRGLFLSGHENVVGMLQDGGADEKKIALEKSGAGNSEKGFHLRRSKAASLMTSETPR